MHQVFISYSRKDIDFVKRLASDLKKTGVAVWWDISGIPPGTEWPKRIQDGLENSDYFIVVLSPDAIQSPWVRKEYTFAQIENKPIFPLYYRPCKIPIALTDINYIDFSHTNYVDGLSQLCDALGIQFEPQKTKQEQNEWTKRVAEQTERERLARDRRRKEQESRARARLAAEQLERERLTRDKAAVMDGEVEKKLTHSVPQKTSEKFTNVGLLLATMLAILLLLVYGLGSSNERFQTGENVVLRFVFVIVGLFVVFIICYNTRDNAAWEIGTRQVVWMAVGTTIYTVFYYLFNGTVFVVPSLSQVLIRPALAIPIFLGYSFGPVIGLFTGVIGNTFGDALTGFGLFPEWSMGAGLAGFIAGLPMLFRDKERSLATVLWTGGALVLPATVLYFLNPDQPNMLFFDPPNNIFGDAQITFFAGVSLLVGFILVLIVRHVFSQNLDIAAAVTWGMLGIILGIGFAAISDIWINGYSPVAAVVGEFLPAAGPNLIFAAILVPLLVAAYGSVQRQSGR
jgi:uncharacterized membrane protein